MAKTVKEVLTKAGAKKGGRKGGGSKKHGRNKTKCGKYRMEGRREKNQKRIAKKILRMVEKKKLKKEGKNAHKI